MYLSNNVFMVVDLMSEARYLKHANTLRGITSTGADSRDIAVLIFYCTLREILLNELIWELMEAQSIPRRVADRLLGDNRTHATRLSKVFPSLTGTKWKDAVSSVDLGDRRYIQVDEFTKNAAQWRNAFLHSGDKWEIDKHQITACLEMASDLITLHVSLHNKFVHEAHFRCAV